MPKLSLEADTLRRFFTFNRRLACGDNELFYLENSRLRLNSSVVGNLTLSRCIYREIQWITDREWAYSKAIAKNENYEIKINSDFFRVQCYIGENNAKGQQNETALNGSDDLNIEWYGEEPAFDQFFAQIEPKTPVLERISQTKPFANSTQMNVLMFGLDSMSHMSYQRLLPKTYAYLKESLQAVILDGYNIVGDATVAALVPILTGNHLSFHSEPYRKKHIQN